MLPYDQPRDLMINHVTQNVQNVSATLSEV